MPSLGLRTQTSAGTSNLRVPTGMWNVLAGGRLQLGLKILVPPRPKEVLFNVFEPKLVDSLLYAMIEFFNHGTQWGASCPLSPTLLLDLHLEAGYAFAPFGDVYNLKEIGLLLVEILHFEDLGDRSVISECSLGVNQLIIDTFFYVASDTSPLYKIWQQSGRLLMEILHFEDLRDTSVIWLWTQLF